MIVLEFELGAREYCKAWRYGQELLVVLVFTLICKLPPAWLLGEITPGNDLRTLRWVESRVQ
jgi:hypothetical protein